MAVQYKQKCAKCKKNYVIITARTRFPVCYDCQKFQLEGEIKDSKIKKLFNIPLEFYKENLFLRDIKANYLAWGRLSEKQVEAFKKTVAKLKDKKTDSSEHKKI